VNNDRKLETIDKDRVLSDLYISVDKITGKIVGIIQIRHTLNPYLKKFGGHIGDSIRPTERNKGYATAQISLALEKCKEFGLNKVLLTCKDWNKASARTIEKNGGILENIIPDDDGNIFNRYWINL
jgi:predicted acetyltransferase